jgi:hypothetical protein
MADWKDNARKGKPLPPPGNIIHEVSYRDRRICLTDDANLVGQFHPDQWGFTTDRGYVVLDAFDEHVFPAGMHWFYTPDDAVNAIEMLDTILPTIQKGTPATTLLYEYGVMRAYRREFWITYNALARMQNILDDAVAFGDDATATLVTELHALRQAVAQGRSVG